jgi:hypothetical protein
MNAMKLMVTLCDNLATSYVTMAAAAVMDMAYVPNSVVAVTDADPAVELGMQALAWTPDTTRPHLVAVALDMNVRQLSLTFDEVVNSTTFSAAELRLQAAAEIGLFGQRVDLTADSTTSSPYGLTLVVDLCDVDFNALKLKDGLVLEASTTYVKRGAAAAAAAAPSTTAGTTPTQFRCSC